MRHLELHIIQSVPVACLNRDDLNSPKTAVFGGVQRARVSSQSWKRAIRELAAEDTTSKVHFKGSRTRLFIPEIISSLQALGEPDVTTRALAMCTGHYLAKLDPKQDGKVKTLMFLSPAEIETIAQTLKVLSDDAKKRLIAAVSSLGSKALEVDGDEDEEAEDTATAATEMSTAKGSKGKDKPLTAKQFKKLVDSVIGPPLRKAFRGKGLASDAADIALFGRMVASDHSFTVEAAAMFSHAISTHKVDNEIDFFSAVDDLQPKEEAGAAMTSTLEFNSATYYRFAALNLDLLADMNHLGPLTADDRKMVVRAFVEATIKAIPGARRNTMNGNTLPLYVLGVVREQGHPIQLVNAFENPIRSTNGYGTRAVELLLAEYAKLKETWGLQATFERSIPDLSLAKFLDEVVTHVR